MEKTTIKIDLTKLDKSRITERKYTKDGVEVTVKEYAIDIIPLREKEVVTSGDTWELVKNSFLTDSPTKEERQSKKKMAILGNGTMFRDKVAHPGDQIPF
jgi:hypothetical protein